MSNINFVENLILVRNEPHIYAFSTNTIPNYLKIGDTFRPVDIRIEEWNKKISEALGSDISVRLTKEYTETAVIDDAYFRDYAVHKFLVETLKKKSISDTEPDLASMYSREFFKDVTVHDVEAAIADIRDEYENENPEKNYIYYKLAEKKPSNFHWNHDQPWKLRPNQEAVVSNFLSKQDKKELLMYAVMRFGKSFTAMYCALKSHAKKVLIVSAKADVATEWKATVEKPECFKDYCFLVDTDFVNDKDAIQKSLNSGKSVAVFLTLQNLTGRDKDNNNIKNKLTEVFATEYDLIIVDETHFGAWAKTYGSALKSEEDSQAIKEDLELQKKFTESHSTLTAKQKLHLSGTPYNLLYDKTFNSENMIASVQFSDILYAKEAWDVEHFEDIENGNINPDTGKPYQEFDNPYFGFPRMLRFAFNPTDDTRAKLSALSKDGKWTLTEMFRAKNGEFVHSADVLKLMKIIDGSESDKNILSFLDIPKVKEHDVCKHMVFVLPYKSSCDAMEKLLREHHMEFINLSQYKVLNVAGHLSPAELSTVEKVKKEIESCENASPLQKTITLTVNKMLTGVTVKEWDTMIMLKNTHSAQEYDQAVFRIQNQYVIEYEASDGSIIKKDMKPQTILVDFDPMRIFEIQGISSNIISEVSNREESFEDTLSTELKYFPIITYNGKNLVKVEPNNIVEIITQYNSQKSILDEASSIKLDIDILSNEYVSTFIKAQSKLDLTNSLTADANNGKGTKFDTPPSEEPDKEDPKAKDEEVAITSDSDDVEVDKDIEKKFRMCMANILFYVFLSNSKIDRLSDVLASLDDTKESARNKRIFKHLSLDAKFIKELADNCNTHFAIDINNKIKNANLLSNDSSLTSEKRAANALDRFSRISDSEVVTPRWICKKMLDSIGVAELAKIVDDGGKILDIASKTGEFAYSIFTVLKDIVDIDKLKACIYSIPTSGVTYEFTRRMYETLDLRLENLANVDNFCAYDLIKQDENGNIDYDKNSILLRQNKSFDRISLEDELKEGEKIVNFDVVIGNPPYQETKDKTSDKQIYNYFMDVAYKLSKTVTLITPAKFLFNLGNTPKSWNQKMLGDEHLKVVYYEPDNAKVFDGNTGTGGIAITIRDEKQTWEPIGIFHAFPLLGKILNKVVKFNDFKPLSDEFVLQNKFNLSQLYKDYPSFKNNIGSKGKEKRLTTSIFQTLPSAFTTEPVSEEDVAVYGLKENKREREIRFINPKYLAKHDNLYSYKVLIPKSNGSGAIGTVIPTQLIGEPIIAESGYGFTQSFISISAINEETARSVLKYVKTKFARCLLGAKKVTQDNNPDAWSYVPVQDFTNSADIDWSKSISEIDKKLYEKYKLSKEEIDFIESMIKPME